MREPAVITDLIALGGAGIAATEFGERAPPVAAVGAGAVRVGVHRDGRRPSRDLHAYDILLSADLDAPAPSVGLGPRPGAALASLEEQVARQPAAPARAPRPARGPGAARGPPGGAARPAPEERAPPHPAPAACAAQVSRASLHLVFAQALVQESRAYSMLRASDGFLAWRAANPPR